MVRLKIISCESCQKMGEWDDIESFFKLTGQEGQPPAKITTGICSCGHTQILEGV